MPDITSQPISDPQTFEAILDSLDEGVLTLTDEGTVIGINRAACGMLEVEKAEALHRGCLTLLGEEFCSQSSRVRQSIVERQPVQGLLAEIRTASGQTKTLSVRTRVLRDAEGNARGGLVVFRDVSELERLRRDLQQRYRLHNIIGKSLAMRQVFELIEQVAESDASVLIEGETGTGKETGRPRHPPPRPACAGSVRARELFRDTGEPARERTVRACPRGVHRRAA